MQDNAAEELSETHRRFLSTFPTREDGSQEESLNDQLREYKLQLGKGQIQKAYKGIMTFMSGLRVYLEKQHPNFAVSALYFGYMDMTYFAFTPVDFKKLKLKIAIVYLHEQSRFEVWLSGRDREIQAEYIALFASKEIGSYRLSPILPGVDSILESILVDQPDFDHPEGLSKRIETKTLEFVSDIRTLLNQAMPSRE